MGSRAYGTETETSDWDFYGFCVPPIEIVFPHTKGEILGFGRNIQHFEQFEAQHVEHPGYGEFDITIYNIVKYFQLLMEGNPNLVDSIFTDDNSVLYMDNIGRIVKEHRHLFLSQKCYHTFKGMMWSHLSRLKTGHIKEGRKELGEKYGYDTKDAYHSTRMIFQLRNILFHADMNLRSNKDVLLAVRCGQITKDEVISFCEEQLVEFEKAKEHFVVRYAPDEDKIRRVLVDCLEESYGNLRKIGYNFA
jgi:predicted nucleotidyltransferase